jgi:hypothetical protein
MKFDNNVKYLMQLHKSETPCRNKGCLTIACYIKILHISLLGL